MDAFAPPEEAFAEAATGGERVVAVSRLVFFVFLWLVPILIMAVPGPAPEEVFIVWSILWPALGISIFFVWLARRPQRISGLPFITSAFDVIVVSSCLVAVGVKVSPYLATNSLVVWDVYIMAILATALRFDARVVVFTGFLSVSTYMGILWFLTEYYDVANPGMELSSFGEFRWPAQVGRLALMITAVTLAYAMVLRTRRVVFMSGTDFLTGLGNRAFFQGRLDAEAARSVRTGKGFGLLFLDIDHFKQFNDQYGHAVGDRALTTVAHVLRSAGRREDVIARWGGEEFVKILPEAKAADAVAQYRRIQEVLRETEFDVGNEATRLTVSAGVAIFPDDQSNLDILTEIADARLRQAKEKGRNCIVAGDDRTENA